MKYITLPLAIILVILASAFAAPQEWYKGGTLANATPIEWKNATQRNKVATCADFIASLWSKKMLKPSIQNSIESMEDFKPYCYRLVAEIDVALRGSTVSPKVSEIATALFITEKWVK